eukprot:6746201-Prymnesium_polylepis.1
MANKALSNTSRLTQLQEEKERVQEELLVAREQAVQAQWTREGCEWVRREGCEWVRRAWRATPRLQGTYANLQQANREWLHDHEQLLLRLPFNGICRVLWLLSPAARDNVLLAVRALLRALPLAPARI